MLAEHLVECVVGIHVRKAVQHSSKGAHLRQVRSCSLPLCPCFPHHLTDRTFQRNNQPCVGTTRSYTPEYAVQGKAMQKIPHRRGPGYLGILGGLRQLLHALFSGSLHCLCTALEGLAHHGSCAFHRDLHCLGSLNRGYLHSPDCSEQPIHCPAKSIHASGIGCRRKLQESWSCSLVFLHCWTAASHVLTC